MISENIRVDISSIVSASGKYILMKCKISIMLISVHKPTRVRFNPSTFTFESE